MKRWRPGSASLAAVIWVVMSLVVGICVPRATAASSSAVVHVSTKAARIGELVQVTGTGWAPVGETVQIELCGQDGLNVSDDCDQANQYTAAIRAGGVFYGAVVTHLPPAPCPCVVLVRNQGSFSGARVPITIVGARNVPVPPQGSPSDPVALSANVSAPASASGWFGGPRKVTLILRVRNLSTAAYPSAALSVNVGRGRNPSGFVVARQMAPLNVGATQVLRIPVTLPAFTFGSYSVRAQVITGQGQVATVVGTSSYPWGLFVVAALLVQMMLLLLRNRARARLARGRPTEIPLEEPGLQPVVEPVEVIDLRAPSLLPADEEEVPVEEPQGAAERLEVVDLRATGTPPSGVWTTTRRLSIPFPEQGLTCKVEVLACPAIRLQRTTIRAWDGFAFSPWDALHEGRVWAETGAGQHSNALAQDGMFSYDGRGLQLELHLTALGPQLSLGDSRTVVPVRVYGSASFGNDTSHVDAESVLEQSWVTEAPDGMSAADSEPLAGSLTYGRLAGGDSFYLQFGPHGGPEGWLVRDGRASAIVHALRRIEGRAGPYPRRLVVEMTDELGRRAVASGTACNGMASREGDRLVLDCRTEWDVDGVAALGVDRAEMDLDEWRAATRAMYYSVNGTSSTQPARPLGP